MRRAAVLWKEGIRVGCGMLWYVLFFVLFWRRKNGGDGGGGDWGRGIVADVDVVCG